MFSKRIAALQKSIKSKAALLIKDPLDLYYLTGLSLSAGHLLVSDKEALLFVDSRYTSYAKEKSTLALADLTDAALLTALKKSQTQELLLLPHKTLLSTASSLMHLLKNERITFVELQQDPIEQLRLIKDSEEKEMLRASAKLAWNGFCYLKENLKLGMREVDAVWLYESYCRQQGASKMAFDPIVAFGKGSAQPHYKSGNKTLELGDIVLVDVGVTLDHYQSDMSRTFFFGKTPDKKLLELYLTVAAAQKAALEVCKAGNSCASLDLAARAVMQKEGQEELFLHSLGHGIGLAVHELPRISSKNNAGEQPLLAGMAITIEPGLYIDGLGGVRYEDTVLITETGYENLFPDNFDPFHRP